MTYLDVVTHVVSLKGVVFTDLEDVGRLVVNMNAHTSFIALFIVVYSPLVTASLSAGRCGIS